MPRPSPTAQTWEALRLAATALPGELHALERRFLRGSSAYALIRSTRFQASGDVPRAIALLESTRRRAPDREQVILDEVLGPLYVSLNRHDDVAKLLEQHSSNDVHRISRHALGAVARAIRGDVEISRQLRSELSELEDMDDLLFAYTMQRCGLAAFYTRDFLEAIDWAMRAANAASAIGADRSAATAYSVLYAIYHSELSDTSMARRYAQAQETAAQKCANASLETAALVAQYEIAAECADDALHAELGQRLAAKPLPQQYLERFTKVIADALQHGWKGDFAALKANVVVIQGFHSHSPAEAAVCYGLRALAETVRGELSDARRNARRALALSDAYKQRRASVLDARLLLQARGLAAAASMLMGDGARGRRTFAAEIMKSPLVKGFLACVEGGPWEHCAPPSRGLARVVAQARSSIRDAADDTLLTPAERQVLQMLNQGLSALAIAEELDRSVHTVRVHIRNVIAKFEVSGRNLAVAEARRRGYV